MNKKLNRKEFVKDWEQISDTERWQRVFDNKELDFTIEVDNDCVTLFWDFDEECHEDNPDYETTPYCFDEYGYHILVTLLQSQKMRADYA